MVPWENLDIFGSRFLIQVVGFACNRVGVIIVSVVSRPGICPCGAVVFYILIHTTTWTLMS